VSGDVGEVRWKEEREVAVQLHGWFDLTHHTTLFQQKQKGATLEGRKQQLLCVINET